MKKRILLILTIIILLIFSSYLYIHNKEEEIPIETPVTEPIPVVYTNEQAWNEAKGKQIGTVYTDDKAIDIPLIQGSSSGTDEASMDIGMAHDPTTSLPGETGPIVMSGHRETYAKGLYDLSIDDIINIKINDTIYKYKIIDSYVITENEASKIFGQTDDKLIMYTCYPPEENTEVTGRYVVEGQLIN
jgi:sortase A